MNNSLLLADLANLLNKYNIDIFEFKIEDYDNIVIVIEGMKKEK